MTIQVTSAIIGGIDEPKEFPAQSLDHNYHTYTQSPVEGTDRIKALYFKTQQHRISEADIYIWIDGKIQVLCYDFIEQCIAALGEGLIAMPAHAHRICVYQEVGYILDNLLESDYLKARYKRNTLRTQIKYYRKHKYPAYNGLNDCCIIVRRNDQVLNSVMDSWWSSCEDGWYDQIDIKYLLWQAKIKVNNINFKPASYNKVNHLVVK